MHKRAWQPDKKRTYSYRGVPASDTRGTQKSRIACGLVNQFPLQHKLSAPKPETNRANLKRRKGKLPIENIIPHPYCVLKIQKC